MVFSANATFLLNMFAEQKCELIFTVYIYIYKQKPNGLSEVMHKECLSIDSTGLTGIFSECKEKKGIRDTYK